jgi:hypothetical protein
MMFQTQPRQGLNNAAAHHRMQCLDIGNQEYTSLFGGIREAHDLQGGLGCGHFPGFAKDLTCPMYEALHIHDIDRAETEHRFHRAIEVPSQLRRALRAHFPRRMLLYGH